MFMFMIFSRGVKLAGCQKWYGPLPSPSFSLEVAPLNPTSESAGGAL